MSNLILPPEWKISENAVTPENTFNNRREFLKMMGAAGLGIAGALYGSPAWAGTGWLDFKNLLGGKTPEKKGEYAQLDHLKRNPAFAGDRPMTEEDAALKYNNFYEFTSEKDRVWKRVEKFQAKPWQVEIGGLVENPAVYDIDDLVRAMPVEERIYRHRCVETWAMVVPWSGFPMKALVKKVKPADKAKYARFVSFMKPEIAPGQRDPSLPWPYTEGLSMEEAMNELTFLAVGVYGHALPPQHGAPLRVATPWKYGFKSAKSIVKIEFTETQPATFWNTLIPHEYKFVSNVDPDVPHPRWSQKKERMIGTGDVYPTQKYNGYGKWVAGLYE
ncbi:MAG: protein-methionine-sulfoxide reductase catalytic subunit MsrP [Nitrospinae bacterium]|nr:protein-methionine-sulfoxide reductase catalytic subunit MsrP [Nitrospinota bacterium]